MISDDKILVYAVRHGETALNAANKFRGSANPPLNKHGFADAHNLAEMFGNISLGCIICSDKLRAVQTAETIGKEKDLMIHKSENLRALNVGDFSGQDRNKENTEALQYYLNNPDEPIPGGESLNEFQNRINPCILEAVELSEDYGIPVMLVCHSSIIHQIGTLLHGDHTHELVEPGGAVAIYKGIDNRLTSEPIYKKAKTPPSGSETVS
jgi:broad specificity phosphatase PhoE